MKILMVNKFYYIKGGSETYYFTLKRILESNGHKVIDFSMLDDKNYPSKYTNFFIENIDYSGKKTLLEKIKMATNIIYSFEAKKKFKKIVQETKPDIIHLHIFQHQISPSILDIAKKYRIPVVYTAHDLKMLCPNYKMMVNGDICEKCKDGHFIECVKNKCVKDSYFKSMINAIEGYFHRWKRSYDLIDKIITPSAFYKNKFIEFGVSADRVIHITNCLDSPKPKLNVNKEFQKYFLYFGRLSEEKGILTLIKAVENTSNLLYIVGTGPLMEKIELHVDQNELSNIKILGFRSGQELSDLIGNSKVVILPSEWYENGPYSAIESLQLGRPLIGSDLGGIPELIEGNGLIFKNGDDKSLKAAIEDINNLLDEDYRILCDKSLEIFSKYYSSANHYSKLMEVYNSLLNLKKSGARRYV